MPVPYSTATYNRYLTNSSTTTSDIDGTTTCVLVYTIERKDKTVIDYNGADYDLMITEGVLPNIGKDMLSWSGSSRGPQETARLREIEFSSNKVGNCTATCRFTTLYATHPKTIDPAHTQPTGNAPAAYFHLPSNVEYSASLRSMRTWRRTWATTPASLAAVDISPSDIAGFAASGGQQGMITEVPQVRIRMRFVLDATVTKMVDQYAQISAYIGKKNSVAFLNFPVGSVICEGITMGHLQQEYYEIILDFLYDDYYHFEQVPDYMSDGTLDINSLGNARTVKWVRTTRSTADFNLIYGTAGPAATWLKNQVERGYWDPIP